MRALKITKTVTDRDDLSLTKYLREINNERMITAEEEGVLAKKIREGDQEALQTLTRANLRFVVSVAKQYQNQGIPLSDLINEGNIGLMKAATKFDESRGFKFISYAVWWIRQCIITAIHGQSRIVALPSNQLGIIKKIYSASRILEQEFEREPTVDELCEMMQLTEDQVKDAIRIKGRQVSIDAPLKEGEDFNLLDTLQADETYNSDNNLTNESLSNELIRIMKRLSANERKVIQLFFGVGGEKRSYSLDEIGVIMELSSERVRQIKAKALKHLLFYSRTLLRSYL